MFIGIFGLFGRGDNGEDHSDHEESGRTRNNENGDDYPTPKQDNDRGIGDYMTVDKIIDSTDDTDGKKVGWWR